MRLILLGLFALASAKPNGNSKYTFWLFRKYTFEAQSFTSFKADLLEDISIEVLQLIVLNFFIKI